MLREANQMPNRRSGEAGLLFYRLRKWTLAVSVDLDMKWVDGMSVEDRQVELVGMDDGMI